MIYVRSPSGRVLAGYVAAGWLSGGVAAGLAILASVFGQGEFARWASGLGISFAVVRLLGYFAVFFSAVAGIAALSLYVGFRSTAELRMRLSELADASAMYAVGKLGHRIRLDATEDADGDVAVTARQLNLMAERLSEQVGVLQLQAQDNLKLRLQLEAGATLRERERVSRELHDRLSQELFGLAMLCETASRQRQKAPDKALELLPELSELARRAQRAMRGLLLELRPAELAGRPLDEALRALCSEVSDRTGVTVEFFASRRGGGAPLSASVEDGLFLIAQEALTNALRHSGASRIEVRYALEPERALVEIRDNGRGIGEVRGRAVSLGLQSMEERARMLGGECAVRSGAGKGTDVTAIIPRVPAKQQGGGRDCDP